MKTISDISLDELNNRIEQKIHEVLGDPDSGLELRETFKEKLKERLSAKSKRISHKEALEKSVDIERRVQNENRCLESYLHP